MAFTKRHYEDIAQVIQETHDIIDQDLRNDVMARINCHAAIELLTGLFVARLAVDNPKFQPGKFRDASRRDRINETL